jgi:uncharacterized protein
MDTLKVVVMAFLAMASVLAVSPWATAADERATILNQNAVGMVVSHPNMASEAVVIARTLDHTSKLRVLPIIGRGSLQSLNDLLFLDSADVAIVSSDSLAYARRQKLYAEDAGKLRYLAKLSNSGIVLLTRGDVGNINDLAGRKVAAGSADSDSFIAASLLFGDVGVDIERVTVNGSEAIAALRDGRIDAALLTTHESGEALAALPANSGLRILPLAASERLADAYAPAILTQEQLPNLISKDQPVETVTAAIVLAVYDWPKTSRHFSKLKTFSAALYGNYFSSLGKDRATNFLAAVPGWKMHEGLRKSVGLSERTNIRQFVAYSR